MSDKEGSGIIGYRYFLGLHIGVCRGPVDELIEIQVGGRKAWPITPDVAIPPPGPTDNEIPSTGTSGFSGTAPFTYIDYSGNSVSTYDHAGVITFDVGGFSNQFIPGKTVVISGTARFIDQLDDNLEPPVVVSTEVNVDGIYTIYSSANGFMSIAVENVDQWILISDVTPNLVVSPTFNLVVDKTPPDPGQDTANGYPANVNKQIYINAPDLFGGSKGEGGVQGKCDIMMGGPTQPVNTSLMAMLGASTLSAFRGVFTMFYDGLVSSFNPYPKEWNLRVRRVLKGWADDNVFLSTKCKIELDDDPTNIIWAMNGAHIIYQCLTDPDWGRGMSSTQLDLDSFTAAANTLFDEEFGLCLKWTRQDNIDVFIQTVIDHIGAVMFVSRSTSKLTLVLIRDNYVVDDLPLFTRTTGALAVLEDQSTSVQPLTNEVIVKFLDPRTGSEGQVRAQNLAAIQSVSSIVSETRQYVGLPTVALANRVAARDLRIAGTPLRRMKISFDRRAYNLQPGAVFRYEDASRGIGNMVLRVGRVEDGAEDSSTINVTCVQDVFGLSATSYIGYVPPVAQPSGGVIPAIYEKVFEASYYDARVLSAVIEANVGYVIAAASRANSLHKNFQLLTGPSDTALVARGSAYFRGGATLVTTVEIPQVVFTLTNIRDGSVIYQNSAALIGNEVVKVLAYNPSNGKVTVGRGCVDTIPAAYPIGTEIIFYDRVAAVDLTSYAESEVVFAKVATRTSAQELNPALADLHQLTIVGRVGRPYPPGNVKVNGIRYGLPVSIDMTSGLEITWAHRNKVTQADTLVDFLAGSVTPDAALTYTIQVRRQDTNGLLREIVGVVGTSWTYSSSMWVADGSIELLTLKLSSELNGETSWQTYSIPVTIQGFGWGRAWGARWDGTSIVADGGVAYSPQIVAKTPLGWVARSYTDTPSPNLRYWRSVLAGGPYTLIREFSTGEFVQRRTAQSSTLLASLYISPGTEEQRLTVVPVDFSVDPTVLIDTQLPPGSTVIAADGSRFLLIGRYNKIYESTDAVNWSLIGTMSGTTFPRQIGNSSYQGWYLRKVGTRWFLLCADPVNFDGPGLNNSRLFYTDNADARTGWAAATGLEEAASFGTSIGEYIEFDGTNHYVLMRPGSSAMGPQLYKSADNGVSWVLDTDFDVQDGNGRFMHVTGTTAGVDYLRVYGPPSSIEGVYISKTRERLIGGSVWVIKEDGVFALRDLLTSGPDAVSDVQTGYVGAHDYYLVNSVAGVFQPVSGF